MRTARKWTDVYAPLDAPAAAVLFLQLAVVLAVARLLGVVAKRVGLAPVVGELLTGLALGPSLLGWVAPGASRALFPAGGGSVPFATVSLLGLVSLLVLAGLETDRTLLRGRARTTVAVAGGGVAVPFAAGFGLGLLLPARFLVDPERRLLFALFLATAMSISAVPIIARVLMDVGVIERELGQVILIAAMVNDAIGWVLLSLVVGLARGESLGAATVVRTTAPLLVVLVGAVLVGRPLVELAVRWTARTEREDAAQLSTLIVLALSAAALTQALGVEAILGAFLVGLFVGEATDFPRSARNAFEAATLGALAPVFFAAAGLGADLGALLSPAVTAVAAAAFAVAVGGKFVGAYVGARAGGLGRWEAIAVGSGLNARGAMEIVVATVGLRLGVLTPALYAVVVLIAVATSLMAPPLLRWSLARASSPAGGGDRHAGGRA